MRHLQLKCQERHGDGEHAVAKGFEPAGFLFASRRGLRLLWHVPTSIVDALYLSCDAESQCNPGGNVADHARVGLGAVAELSYSGSSQEGRWHAQSGCAHAAHRRWQAGSLGTVAARKKSAVPEGWLPRHGGQPRICEPGVERSRRRAVSAVGGGGGEDTARAKRQRRSGRELPSHGHREGDYQSVFPQAHSASRAAGDSDGTRYGLSSDLHGRPPKLGRSATHAERLLTGQSGTATRWWSRPAASSTASGSIAAAIR